tara:strand:- start:267 stop:752 length:486 start_codon:yes stop_codon:yes gene_type:complete
MFSDPQFWVAISFLLFILVIFNPVRKILITSLDSQINDIKSKIEEAENIKNEASRTLKEIKIRENEVQSEIKKLKSESEKKITELKELSSKKLLDQIDKRKLLADIKIEQVLRDTNSSIKNYISDTAIKSSLYILNNNLSDEKKSEIVNNSITELKNVLKN